nr:hypothetical protein [uncultured Mediterraneibacter sp.]
MRNKKLYATLIAGALAVSMMGTTVMASTASTTANGQTKFTYSPGTAGPTDPIAPGNEENANNNWMVTYPRTITLMDNNEAEAAQASTKGQAVAFTVKQRQAGADNSDKVTAGNVGDGIQVSGTWTGGNSDIAMNATSGGSTVKMGLVASGTTAFLNSGGTVTTLTVADPDNEGYAVIKTGQVSQAVEGATYTATIDFTFTRTGN